MVHANDNIHFIAVAERTEEWLAQDIPITIVYEDEELLVVNKASPMIVHPGSGVYENTLVNALLYHCPSLKQLPRAGLIHRLDKETTGLLVVAKTLTAHRNLTEQMQERSIKRMYQAASPEERKKFGYDVPNDADDADLEITRLKNEWLRDGKPVD